MKPDAANSGNFFARDQEPSRQEIDGASFIGAKPKAMPKRLASQTSDSTSIGATAYAP
jgi:hypothetical protein